MPPSGMSTGMTQAEYDEKLRLNAEAKKKAEDSACVIPVLIPEGGIAVSRGFA